jgi:hypothetical protein
LEEQVKRSLGRRTLFALAIVGAAMMVALALTPTLYVLFVE